MPGRVALADACVIYMNRRNILAVLYVSTSTLLNRRQKNGDDANLASQSTGW
jgi:hypothetical protein